MVIMTFSMFIGGFIFSFITGWLMTLVVIATLPVLLFAGYLFITAIINKNQEKQYFLAGGKA